MDCKGLGLGGVYGFRRIRMIQIPSGQDGRRKTRKKEGRSNRSSSRECAMTRSAVCLARLVEHLHNAGCDNLKKDTCHCTSEPYSEPWL